MDVIQLGSKKLFLYNIHLHAVRGKYFGLVTVNFIT